MWHQVARKGGFSVGLAGWVVMVATLLPAGDVAAQRMSWLVEELAYRRSVDVPGGRETPEAVVADFYTHGQLKGDGSDLVVYARRSVVPFRILQIGPGDYCRVAFQPAAGQTLHQIYYGGQLRRPVEQPSWNPKHGLLMETRRWHNCNLNQLESVRGAFRAAEPIGADYVPTVFHRFNPFDVEPRPFLSRYVGTLRVPRAGKVEFYTASQDCSFLLIDGKLVVADPGRHRPRGRARHKGELELDLRPHRFEYYHAASGRETCMVAAWKLEGDRRPRPIPPTAFGSQWIARAPATRLEHKTERLLPDFRLAVLGDVPLPGDYPALVRTQLFDVSGKTVTLNAQLHWDFGDGQTSQEQNPTHIYLHPGPYQITLTVRRGASSKQIKNQVYVMRQVVLNKEQLEQGDKLADYLNILATYDPRKLDPPGLIQLVRVYLQVKQPERAALVGAAAFTDQAVAHTDATRWQILQLVGPLLRVQLNKPDMALEMYRRAGRMISRSDWRAICAIEAADILVNDLLKPAEAKPLLEFATASRKALGTVDASRLERVWGDWHALQGDGQAAATAYRKAQQLRQLSRSPTEQAAWRGAHSRSCESFLRDGALDRMRQELQKWENDFPADKLDGYLPYLQARYWAARKQFPQAIAVATQLLTVSPDSPYADRLLLLSAECEEKLGRTDRAAAAYQSLVTDYPGSPLVERARQRLDQLKGAGGNTGGSNSPNE